jgi:hypothetical protein
LKNQTNNQDVLGILKTIRVDQQDIKKFEQKLLDLADEFGKSSAQKGVVYSLNVSLYPMDTEDLLEQEIAIRIEG